MTTTEKRCPCCGNDLSGEEIEYPRTDEDGDNICEECYHEKYEFTCCRCQEYGDVADQHNLLVVFEETSNVAPGIYKIVRKPYYTHAMIGSGWLWPESLKRIADVNPDMDGDGYPCGHLCIDCQAKVLAQKPGKCSCCGQKSASCLKVKLGSWRDFKTHIYQWTRAKIVCAVCRHKHKGAWKLAERGGDYL